MPSVDGFFEYDMRVGTVIRCEEFPEARNPAYKLWLDFGSEEGTKQSSARITDLYSSDELVGRQVVCVTNFPPRQIGPFRSEVLVLGVETSKGVALLGVDRAVADGTRVS